MMIRKNQEFNELAMKQMLGKDSPEGAEGKNSGFAESAGAIDEDEMMRRALEESAKMQDSVKNIVDEEEEMIKQAILASQ
jgi:hypothetical protein